MIEFEHMWAFGLLPLPVIIYLSFPIYKTPQKAIKVPFFNTLVRYLGVNGERGTNALSAGAWHRSSLFLGWLLLVLAAAKPVWLGPEETRELAGRDIMIVLDLSGSMATRDFVDSNNAEQSRLSASKSVLKSFVEQREADRFGLIIFGDSAFLQSPFTIDHAAWLRLLNETQPAMAGQSTHLGDAIGLGIKTFISEVKNQDKETLPTREHLMVVLTDGNDTDSLVPPIDAAKVAAANGIKIHIVAMGNPETRGEQAVDMETIKQMTTITGGEDFLAMSTKELTAIYDTINRMEPSVFDSYRYQPKQSLHYVPILMAFLYHLLFMLYRVVKYSALASVTTLNSVTNKEAQHDG